MLSPKSKPKHLREPPPSLFLGPPSHNASQISISNTGSTAPNNPLTLPTTIHRQRSQLGQSPLTQTTTHASSNRALEGPSIENTTSNISSSLSLGTNLSAVGTEGKDFAGISTDIPNPLPLPTRSQTQMRRIISESQKQADRTDALWAEMQSTLEEVDLSASYNIAGNVDGHGRANNGGMHVFGPDHSKVLEDLRCAQMELAKAWARSEGADDEEERRGGDRSVQENATGSKSAAALRSVPSDAGRSHGDPSHPEKETSHAGKSTAHSGSASGNRPRESGRIMEEETQSDILLARKRREANDKYFKKVNEGVLDVVGKLEIVASAMREVERESRDIWGEDDSVMDGSLVSTNG